MIPHKLRRKMSAISICITELPRDQHSISKFHTKRLKCWQQPPLISHVSWNSVFLWNSRNYQFVFHCYDCRSLSVEVKGFTRNREFFVYCSPFKKNANTRLFFCMHILTLTLEETTCLFDIFQMQSQQGSFWLWICKIIWIFSAFYSGDLPVDYQECCVSGRHKMVYYCVMFILGSKLTQLG